MGQRARFRRLRRFRYHYKLPALGALGVVVPIAVLLFVVHISPVRALRLHVNNSSTLHHVGAAKTKQQNNAPASGSSKQAPAGVSAAKAGLVTQSVSSTLISNSCNDFPPGPAGLASSGNSELSKLAQYEQVCGGQVAARSSFFVPTPSTVAEAQSYATDVISDLNTYAQYGITPLVFMEPDSATGDLLDLTQYSNGAYDTALDAYFADIRAGGITDSMMGMWVMLPEGNIPEWTSVDPATFVADVTKVAGFQKKYFPASQTSIMLDSETYPSATSWDNGAYVSLLPYVQGIPSGLINSFGLQGFPWAPPANQGGDSLYNPQVYLRTDLAAAAARALGVSSIWLNTGTFGTMYAGDAAEQVTDTPLQRQTMLAGVVTLARGLQTQGFSVSVHLFAQDKASDSEGTDWSYWQTPGDGPDTTIFETFVHNLNVTNIPLWLFDTY